MEGTNKAHENGEAVGLVCVRLTDQLGCWPMMNIISTECTSLHNGWHSIFENLQSCLVRECVLFKEFNLFRLNDFGGVDWVGNQNIFDINGAF